jgi:HTH-type transcriptional regulator/antitoxin HigA
MTKYTTLDNLEESYFRDHPEEIDTYVAEIFSEYAADGNSAALLASLRIIAKVKGITELAKQTGPAESPVQQRQPTPRQCECHYGCSGL